MRRRVMAPGPTRVPEESRLAMAEDPGYHRTPSFARRLEEVTRGLREILGVDWPVVTLAASGTGGMEMAVGNLVSPDGTVLVVEAGKFGERWSRLLERRGAEVVPYSVEWGSTFCPDAVAQRVEEHPGVRTVFTTLVETSTLVRHPVEELGDRLPSETLVVVDAISGLGAEPFDPAEHGIDAVVGGSQKGLMAPPGLAFLAVGPRAEARAEDVQPAGTYFDLTRAVDRLTDGFQTPWTPALPLVRSLQVSLERFFEEGAPAVRRRHRTVASVCRNGVRALGLELFAERPSVVGTAVKVPGGVDGPDLRNRLDERYGVFVPGGQKHLAGRILRLGHLGDVDYFDVLTMLAALEQALRDGGYAPPEDGVLDTAQTTFRDARPPSD